MVIDAHRVRVKMAILWTPHIRKSQRSAPWDIRIKVRVKIAILWPPQIKKKSAIGFDFSWDIIVKESKWLFCGPHRCKKKSEVGAHISWDMEGKSQRWWAPSTESMYDFGVEASRRPSYFSKPSSGKSESKKRRTNLNLSQHPIAFKMSTEASPKPGFLHISS